IMWGWINVDDVLKTIANKPEMLNLIITGRDADPKLVETADLVTEMKEIKHPYTDQGIPAQKGVEF
ncbi:MAG: cob(I)yrinic acid a,c-diamide adenosyltransferase, partial [Dehalococcoidia bacterium]|nr:cob(I)yrinic acid a,c-diamide adenosyltransferase [Dehalococcoidia bacterium]